LALDNNTTFIAIRVDWIEKNQLAQTPLLEKEGLGVVE
jgi:hypothetical protein